MMATAGTRDRIKYRDGYKNQLRSDYTVRTGIIGRNIETDFILLSRNGLLKILAGYAWDGATWCPDFKSIIRGSLVHDAFYQLFRGKKLPLSLRREADMLLYRMCIEDGMPRALAWCVYKAVTVAGLRAATRQDADKVAP